jgi:hypothetical protein
MALRFGIAQRKYDNIVTTFLLGPQSRSYSHK